MATKIKKLTSRVLILVLIGFLLTSCYYMYNIYRTKIDMAEQGTSQRLESISKTLSTQINGTILKMLLEKYEEKDDVLDHYIDPYYREIAELLKKTVKTNNLPTDIYTLTLDSDSKTFFFGISSADKQYYRHLYENPPEVLKEQYENGAIIPVYRDNHGTWLSAFTPILSSKGDVVAVVQVDMPFDAFIRDAQKNLYRNITYTLLSFGAITLLMLYWLRKLLMSEEKMVDQLEATNQIIAKKNEDITASISYAKRIQDSLMDSENKLKDLLPESFVLFKPKDIVSGDFYWIHSLSKDCSKLAIAAADCTGHGVPGALVSVLGITFLREIVNEDPSLSPDVILSKLNTRILETFSEHGKKLSAKDGMDISLCIIDKNKKTLSYAGAYRPLTIISKGELTEIAGDKKPIGSDHFQPDRSFTNHELTFEKGDCFYMFSDGYVDQFGGDLKKKFMKKRFKNILLDIHLQPEHAQLAHLNQTLEEWMGNTDQIDDITVLGFRL